MTGTSFQKKSKKDGGFSLLTKDSDSMAISFFSFSLLKGWQGDSFRRRDEKDSFPRRKTENGDPARKAVFLFFPFSFFGGLLEARAKDGGRNRRTCQKKGRWPGEDERKNEKKKERRSIPLLLLLSYSLVLSK